MSRVWLITDAAHGLGRTLADAALRAGARVVAGARDPGLLASLAKCHGARVRIVGFDVADEASIYAAVDEALTAFGRIDVVVSPAGRADAIANGEMSDADLRARFETDFFGFAAVAHAVLPILREQGGGRFVQIAASGDDAHNAAGRAVQTALRTYLEALGREVACDGVDIDTIEPGAILAEAIGRATAEASRTKPSARVVRLPARPEAA